MCSCPEINLHVSNSLSVSSSFPKGDLFSFSSMVYVVLSAIFGNGWCL